MAQHCVGTCLTDAAHFLMTSVRRPGMWATSTLQPALVPLQDVGRKHMCPEFNGSSDSNLLLTTSRQDMDHPGDPKFPSCWLLTQAVTAVTHTVIQGETNRHVCSRVPGYIVSFKPNT